MRLKRIAIIGLVIGLLLIALPVYAGMCKRNTLCRARAYPMGARATVAATRAAVPYSETGVQNYADDVFELTATPTPAPPPTEIIPTGYPLTQPPAYP